MNESFFIKNTDYLSYSSRSETLINESKLIFFVMIQIYYSGTPFPLNVLPIACMKASNGLYSKYSIE